MDTILILTILVVIFALAFDFINGFHDTANAIATSVSTRALKPRVAVLMAAIMNFVGALTFTGVAKTISKDIVDPFALAKRFTRHFSCITVRNCLEFNYLVFRNSFQFFPHVDWLYCWCCYFMLQVLVF